MLRAERVLALADAYKAQLNEKESFANYGTCVKEFGNRRLSMESKASGEVSAYFGKGSKISGKLNFEGTVRVDGRVDGEIHAKDTLVIGDTAEVMAEIHATSIVVRGTVRGDIHATKKVEIRAPGKLYGNILAPALVIEEGVIFEGTCTMENIGAKAQAQVKPLGRKEEAPASERAPAHTKEAKENVG